MAWYDDERKKNTWEMEPAQDSTLRGTEQDFAAFEEAAEKAKAEKATIENATSEKAAIENAKAETAKAETAETKAKEIRIDNSSENNKARETEYLNLRKEMNGVYSSFEEAAIRKKAREESRAQLKDYGDGFYGTGGVAGKQSGTAKNQSGGYVGVGGYGAYGNTSRSNGGGYGQTSQNAGGTNAGYHNSGRTYGQTYNSAGYGAGSGHYGGGGYTGGTYQAKPKKAKSPRKGVAVWVLVLCMLLTSVFGGVSGAAIYRYAEAEGLGVAGIPGTTQQMEADGTEDATLENAAVAADSGVINNVMDSVVCIETKNTILSWWGPQEASGAGSGVIISQDGYIITCAHVISDASEIYVLDNQNNEYEAEVIGTNEKADLALIKVDATGLTAATMADSDTYNTGDSIYVVGNPLGNFVLSVSRGIISGLDREANIEGYTMNLIQVDAAVNPGNSGGGLFDAQGRLIGIVNAKNTGIDVEGMGFAIPIDTVQSELKGFMKNAPGLDL